MGADLRPRSVTHGKRTERNNKPSRYRSERDRIIICKRVNTSRFSACVHLSVILVVCGLILPPSPFLAVLNAELTRTLICIHAAKSELREARIQIAITRRGEKKRERDVRRDISSCLSKCFLVFSVMLISLAYELRARCVCMYVNVL